MHGSSFTYQAAKRYVENLALELAFMKLGSGHSMLSLSTSNLDMTSQATGLYVVHKCVDSSGLDQIVCVQAQAITHSLQLSTFLNERILSQLPIGTEISCYTEFIKPMRGISGC
jgi:hypothetical protein